METTPRKIETRPPRVIVAIVEGLIPYPHREYALGDLCQGYVSFLRFIAQSASWVLCSIATQVRRSFNIRLSAAEACALLTRQQHYRSISHRQPSARWETRGHSRSICAQSNTRFPASDHFPIIIVTLRLTFTIWCAKRRTQACTV